MTTRIRLIVTGKLEEKALHRSLRHLFALTSASVEFLAPLKEQDFTSTPLTTLPPEEGVSSSRASKLAARIVAELHPGRSSRAERADYVIAVDDLELANERQPGFVLDYLRRTIRNYVRSKFPQPAEQSFVFRKLATRASFHLLVPMVEAYFFGEPAALVRASATLAPNLFDSARDVEDFEVNDPDYMALTPPKVEWHPRPRHPKNYVRYLCDPQGTRSQNEERAYRETHEGYEALSVLDWRTVLKNPAHGAFMRSLIDDLADALNIPSPCPGPCAPLTARGSGEHLLRNI
ncbi:hypothetical protein [Pyxidicoccus xibeiensis]|uniref:hypothetical protein n=1 Tax=Pyxidicoccus xibeiensis TaxID=2906759 RepID=UPI0020A7624C|nr:hypothetical protein [Pyxidicoccus xibeiensis]MCP3137296.1 hypothetical protein [Pyxidicoccus xibeiensis]